MTLFHLMLMLRDNRTVRLSYHSEAAANTHYELLMSGTIEPLDIGDQYGKQFKCAREFVVGVELVDVSRDLEGMIEQQILQAHANTKLQRRAASDPMIKGGQIIPANHSMARN